MSKFKTSLKKKFKVLGLSMACDKIISWKKESVLSVVGFATEEPKGVKNVLKKLVERKCPQVGSGGINLELSLSQRKNTMRGMGDINIINQEAVGLLIAE